MSLSTHEYLDHFLLICYWYACVPEKTQVSLSWALQWHPRSSWGNEGWKMTFWLSVRREGERNIFGLWWKGNFFSWDGKGWKTFLLEKWAWHFCFRGRRNAFSKGGFLPNWWRNKIGAEGTLLNFEHRAVHYYHLNAALFVTVSGMQCAAQHIKCNIQEYITYSVYDILLITVLCMLFCICMLHIYGLCTL